MKSLLEHLSVDSTPQERREAADRANMNPDEFIELLDNTFSASSSESDTKHRILDLVDLYNTRLALSVIERALEDGDSRIRVRGLQAAYRSQVDSFNAIIQNMLLDKNEQFDIRKWSLHILGKTDPRSYNKTIRTTARDSSEDVRIRKEAVFALTENLEDETIGTLCALLGDPDVEIRQSVAWALCDISSPDTINCLLAALEDPDETVRDWAIRGLRDMDDSRALEKLADAVLASSAEEQVRMIRLVVEKRSEVILRAIVVLLDSPAVEVRRVAAWAMGVSPYPPAVASLKPLLDDDDDEVSSYARVALVRSGGLDPEDLRI